MSDEFEYDGDTLELSKLLVVDTMREMSSGMSDVLIKHQMSMVRTIQVMTKSQTALLAMLAAMVEAFTELNASFEGNDEAGGVKAMHKMLNVVDDYHNLRAAAAAMAATAKAKATS